jgi:hypothetical protein
VGAIEQTTNTAPARRRQSSAVNDVNDVNIGPGCKVTVREYTAFGFDFVLHPAFRYAPGSSFRNLRPEAAARTVRDSAIIIG